MLCARKQSRRANSTSSDDTLFFFFFWHWGGEYLYLELCKVKEVGTKTVCRVLAMAFLAMEPGVCGPASQQSFLSALCPGPTLVIPES